MDFYNGLSKLNLGAFRTSRKLPLFGFVFREFEAAIHFHNSLSKLNLGAFRASRKLGLFVQVDIFLGRDSLVEGINMGPGLAGPRQRHSGVSAALEDLRFGAIYLVFKERGANSSLVARDP